MKKHHVQRNILVIITAVIGIFSMACGADSKSGHGQGQPKSAAHRPAKPAMPAMAVAVEAATRGAIATYYSATSSLDPDKKADMLARVNGVVEKILVEEGDFVEEGQELLLIGDDEYQHRLTQADVAREQQRLRVERIEKIRQQGLVSAEEYDIAGSDLKAAQASWELAALELSYTRVRASFSGRVIARHVDPGRTVAPGAILFTISDTHRLLARVHVPAREFRRIRTDQPVHLVVDSSGDELKGRIDLISPIVDPATGTIKVTVEVLTYPPTTRQGDFAEVSIVTDRHEDSLLVPQLAVLTERDERIVYVAHEKKAVRRVVEIGFEDDQNAEILSGIEAGDMVVVQGQRSLSDGQELTILGQMDFSDQPTSPEQTSEKSTENHG